jgi:c-di-GMP-related signal transduction protein
MYVARHPIFDRVMETFGYELVFNAPTISGATTSPAAFSPESDYALAGGRSLVVAGDPRPMAKMLSRSTYLGETVVAVPASLPASDDVLEAALHIERLGGRVAMDGIQLRHLDHALMKVASIARIDATRIDDELKALVRELSSTKLDLMATNVSSAEAVEPLKDLGFDYFTGQFISIPQESQDGELPALATSRLLLLRELNRPELDVDGLAQAISTDVAMTYRLLTLINSAAIGLKHTVTSVRQATIMLGMNGIRKWASVLVLQEIGSAKSRELIIQSLIRATFCEAIAQRGPLVERSSELYLLGLFSMIDALLDRPMDLILRSLPLAIDLKDALQGETNEVSRVLDLVTAYENANWSVVDRIAIQFAQQEERVAHAYRQAVAQATELAAAA